MVTVPLETIFHVRYGHSMELNRMDIVTKNEKGIDFVSRKMGDNGISARVKEVVGIAPGRPGEITCALGGNGVLSSFIQDREYYCGRDVARLIPKKPMTRQQLLYYCTCIYANRYRFSYGRQANRSLRHILVPAISEVPDYVKDFDLDIFVHGKKPSTAIRVELCSSDLWKYFKLESIFKIKKGKRLTKANMTEGTTPYIGATDSNNGVTGYIGQDPIHDGGTISVTYNGSVAEAFYQPIPFWATDDVNVLYPKFPMTPKIAIFLCTILRAEKYRYNYGRKWHLERMKETEIKLPVDEKGNPDWSYMEEYISSLPYSSQIS